MDVTRLRYAACDDKYGRSDREGTGPALTRVAVEHRGWEQLTDEELARDCVLEGGYLGGAYREGWACILGRFAVAIGGQ